MNKQTIQYTLRTYSNSRKGRVVLLCETPKRSIQINITKTGKVRVYDYKTKKELK